MKKILLALAVAATAVGCTVAEEGGVPFGKNILRVSTDEGTRTEIVTDDDVTFYHNWVKGDAIALFDATDILKYELVGDGGSTVGDFAGNAPAKQEAPFYAIYPYKDNIDIYNDATHQSKFRYDFPSEFEYEEGKELVGSNVMIGFTDGKSLAMKNACSYIRFSISSPFLAFLDEIEIIARGGEIIAGPHLVGIDGAGVPFTEFFDAAVPGDTKPLYDRVKVTFGESKFITANTSTFYIPLPAVELSDGLTFILKGDFAGEATMNLTSSTATLERNTVLVMDEYRFPSEEARIGDVVYETIDEAFAAANASNEPCTITLLRTCAAGARLPLNDAGTGDVTLDLRGKTLSMTNQIRVTGRNLTILDSFSDAVDQQGTITTTYTGGRAIYVESGGSCTVKAGNIISTAAQGMWTNGTIIMEGNSTLTSNGSGIYLNGPDATLVVKDNVKITSETSNAVYMANSKQADIGDNVTITNSGAATLYIVKGTLNVTGGDFSRTGSGNGYIIYTEGADAVVNVSGGWFDNFGTTSATSCVTATSGGGTVNVTGGYFNSYGINPVASTDPGVATVTGGYFNKGIQPRYAGTLVNVLNDDPATCETYPFTVAEGDVVAITTQSTYSWNCGSVECAFKSANQRALANGNTTATMQMDAASDETLTVVPGNKHAVILDLNGHKVSSTANPAISAASNFTLMDSGTEGEVSTTGAVALESTAGNAAVNSGSLYGATNAISVAGGAVALNNGHFYGGGSADIVKSSGSILIYSGFYRYKPDNSWLSATASSSSTTESFNGRTYNYKIEAVVATLNGVGYSSLADAMADAVSYSGSDATLTIQLMDDISYNTPLTLVNENDKPVILDLNGHVLSTSATNFIYPSAGTITITDSKNKVGKITTSSYQLVYAGGTSNITISNCILEGTMAEASGTGSEMLMLSGGTSVVTISGSRIYTCGKQTVLRLNNSNCQVTIDDSELSSGINSTDSFFVIANNDGYVTINSGSFYSKNNSVIQHTNTSNQNMTTTVNGGYFYSGAGSEYCMRANRGRSNNGLVLNGGYMNIEPSGSKVYYGTGKSLKTLDTPVTHQHLTTNATLSYGFSVE